MTVPGELGHTLSVLESLGIRYAVTGSLASVAWGRPRATYDADILVDLDSGDIDRLKRQFPEPDWYFDLNAANQAVREKGEFNLVHGASATKVDLWINPGRPFDAGVFARRRRESLAGVACWVLSPEDTILTKLEWIKRSPSDRQKSDVTGVLSVQSGNLDLQYLNEWAHRLNVDELLAEAMTGRW